jgi:hypothetical protein
MATASSISALSEALFISWSPLSNTRPSSVLPTFCYGSSSCLDAITNLWVLFYFTNAECGLRPLTTLLRKLRAGTGSLGLCPVQRSSKFHWIHSITKPRNECTPYILHLLVNDGFAPSSLGSATETGQGR